MQHNTAKSFTRGGQVTFHNWRMLFQISGVIGKLFIISLLIITALITYAITPKDIILSAYYWGYSSLSPLLELLGYKAHVFAVPYQGMLYYETPEGFLLNVILMAQARAIYNYLIYGVAIGFIVSLGVAIFFNKWLIAQGEKQTSNQFLRGSKLESSSVVAKMVRKDGMASDICIEDVPLIAGSETQHMLVHGTTGAGKSQLTMKLLDHLRRRGDKVFLYDKGCTYTPIYYRAGVDKILNPFDTRSENWDMWREALEAPDFENMAESLIPMHGETDPFWVNAARTIFGSAAFTMQDDKERSLNKLLKLLLTSDLPELEKYLAHTEAATLASDKIEKTAISIRSIITTYLKSLRFLQGVDQEKKPPFSIRDWIHKEYINKDAGIKDDSWLFLSSNAEQHAALRPLISMWFAMASITLLSLPENENRRIWFVCDELPSLHKLPQLPETIAEARKFGGCFVLGMQSYAQLEKVYGRNAARGIFDLLNTRFFFRSPSADMAQLVSKELGEQEFEDMRENYSYGANTIRDGISFGAQQMTKPIVVYPEIMNLADLKCYLRLPAGYPVTQLDLKFARRNKVESGFILRDIKPDPEIEKGIKNIEKLPIAKVTVKKITPVNQENAEAKEATDGNEDGGAQKLEMPQNTMMSIANAEQENI